MSARAEPELLLLHALPLDGSMWAGQMKLLPGSAYAPTLYALGDSVEQWAAEALQLVRGDWLIGTKNAVGRTLRCMLARRSEPTGAPVSNQCPYGCRACGYDHSREQIKHDG